MLYGDPTVSVLRMFRETLASSCLFRLWMLDRWRDGGVRGLDRLVSGDTTVGKLRKLCRKLALYRGK